MARVLITDHIVTLLQQHHLLSAPQLVEKLHAQGHAVNKTTVYRALEKLETNGEACKHNLHDNELVYELRGHHHDHLICTSCGKVASAECELDLPSTINGFHINHHHLSLFGLCAECQSKYDQNQ